MISLRDSFVSLATQDEMISRGSFQIALAKAGVELEKDLEILDLLFTMWDSEGAEQIPYKEFATGISPLACPNDNANSVLRFAMQVSDEADTGMIGPGELEDILLRQLMRVYGALMWSLGKVMNTPEVCRVNGLR